MFFKEQKNKLLPQQLIPGGSFLRLIPEFEAAHLWRFVIDGNRQETGPFTFDVGNKGEPGYLAGMMKGLDYVATSLHEPLTCDFIESLHDECIKNVKLNIEAHNKRYKELMTPETLQFEVIDIEPPKPVPMLNIRDNTTVNFGLLCVYLCNNRLKKTIEDKANITKNGLSEVIEYIKSINEQYGPILSLKIIAKSQNEQDTTVDINNFNFEQLQDLISKENKIVIRSEGIETRKLKKIISDLILDYESKIEQSKDDEKKIKIIAGFVQKLEILHPFTDANCRTFCVLLLNKLLLENKLTPVIMDNPNRFDGFSTEELVQEIKDGQNKYLKFQNHNRCNELLIDVSKLVQSSSIIFKGKNLNKIFSKYTTTLTPLERLNLIEHTYINLFINKLKNHEDYLPLLKDMYKTNLKALSNKYNSSDLHEIISRLNAHHLSKSFQSVICKLEPKESSIQFHNFTNN